MILYWLIIFRYTGSREILYRVELPYMEELTLVYLEKEDDEDTMQLSKSTCENGVVQSHISRLIYYSRVVLSMVLTCNKR